MARKSTPFRLALAVLLSAVIGGASSAWAAPQRIGHVEVDLIADAATIQPGTPFFVGLHFKLDPHWHVYWINPGDAGFAPTLELDLPDGWSAGELLFPAPEGIAAGPLLSYGYETEVLFPLELTPPADLAPGTTLTLNATSDWLVCKEECIPGDAEFTLDLAVSAPGTADSVANPLFTAAHQRLPLKNSGWSAGVIDTGTGFDLYLAPPPGLESSLAKVEVYVVETDLLNYAAPQTLEAYKSGYVLRLEKNEWAATDPITGLTAVLVAPAGWRGEGSETAIEVVAHQGIPPALANMDLAPPGTSGTPLAGSAGGSGGSGGIGTLGVALLFAFLGGIILNLMPCVLPVVALKVFGFIKHADEGRPLAIKHSLVFTAGVVLSFLILAVALIALRAAGESVGLGFHLQSPLFLFVLCAFLFLFALSMLGMFEIGASVTGLAGRAQGKSGFTGSFINGVTATIVATPCTAPFMGPALGFGLTQPPWAILAIFSAIGLGMAAPYVLLAASPALLQKLPKPGPWMDTFRQLMGFLLLATIVWLTWVLGTVAGTSAIIALLATLLLLGFGSWILQRFSPVTAPFAVQRRAQIFAAAIMLVGLFAGINGVQSAPSLGGTPANAQPQKAGGIPWETFSAERVSALTANQQSVLIDFTAAWCLSCQVNERVALEIPAVRERLAELEIATLKADWTRRDPAITAALATYGRNSVPLYVLIGPSGEPTFLPEILTPSIVLDALNELEG